MRNASQDCEDFLPHRHLSKPTPTKAVDKGIKNIEAYTSQYELAEGPLKDRATSFLLKLRDLIKDLDQINETLDAQDRKNITYALVRLVDAYLLKASDDDRRLRFSRLATNLGSKWQGKAKTLNERYNVSVSKLTQDGVLESYFDPSVSVPSFQSVH